jgi:light-regulated signal transduction histidine kinase (bacteriophytochrome)
LLRAKKVIGSYLVENVHTDEALPTLFDKYTQFNAHQNYGGTGLGLAICKNLVSSTIYSILLLFMSKTVENSVL